MSELTLYTNNTSRGNTVDLLLKILDAPYHRVEVTYGAEMNSDRYLEINPMGKVPALVDGDHVVTETAAICVYLADKFIEKGLAPAFNDPKRADYYRWFFFTAGPIESAWTVKLLGYQLNEEQQFASGFGSLERSLACMEKGLANGNPFLCGDKMTAVDVYIGSFLIFLIYKMKSESSEVIDRYLDNLKSNLHFAEIITMFE